MRTEKILQFGTNGRKVCVISSNRRTSTTGFKIWLIRIMMQGEEEEEKEAEFVQL